MKKLHAGRVANRLFPICMSLVLRFAPVLILLLLGTGLAWGQSAAAGSGGESLWALREKYAQKLGVPADSVQQMSLYQMLDRWPQYAVSKSEQLSGRQQHGIFAQFIYYLAFKTKIPSSVEQAFRHEKTFLFKDPAHLRSGDLLFFGKTAEKPDGVVVYLQNNIVVYPGRGGELVFMSLAEIEQQYILTGAKILKNE